MNWFQNIYCNQYAELKAKNSNISNARKNGIIVITAIIVLNIFTVIELFMLFGSHTHAGNSLTHFFRQFGSGRTVGKLLALVLMGIIGAVIYFTIGSERYFQKTVDEFELLEDADKKAAHKKGTVFLLASVGVFILTMVIVMIYQ